MIWRDRDSPLVGADSSTHVVHIYTPVALDKNLKLDLWWAQNDAIHPVALRATPPGEWGGGVLMPLAIPFTCQVISNTYKNLPQKNMVTEKV